MVIELYVAKQWLVHIERAIEPVGLEHVADPVIEALDHPVGLGRARRGQSALNPQILAQHVKFMIFTGLTFTRGKQSIGELFSVVDEQSVDLDRTGFVQGIQKSAGARRTLVLFDLHKHPVRCPFNHHKQVASRGLVSHLRQILDIDVHKAWRIAFKGIVSQRGGLRFDRNPVPHAMAAKASAQTRTRNALIEKLAGDRQKAIQREKQCTAQVHEDRLPGGGQRCLKRVSGVRKVLKRVPRPQLVDGCDNHVTAQGQNPDWIVTGHDLLSNRRDCMSSLLKRHQHRWETPTPSEQNRSINPRITFLAMSTGYRHKSVQTSGTLRPLLSASS